MNREQVSRITNGIRAYSHEQQVLLRLIRKHGRLSQNHFDDIFSSQSGLWNKQYKTTDPVTGKTVMKPRMRKLSGNGICGDSFMLGGLTCEKDWAWWLDLLQHMMAINLVDTHNKDGVIYYFLPKEQE